MSNSSKLIPKCIVIEQEKVETHFPIPIERKSDTRYVEINQPLALEDWQLLFVQNGKVFILNLYLNEFGNSSLYVDWIKNDQSEIESFTRFQLREENIQSGDLALIGKSDILSFSTYAINTAKSKGGYKDGRIFLDEKGRYRVILHGDFIIDLTITPKEAVAYDLAKGENIKMGWIVPSASNLITGNIGNDTIEAQGYIDHVYVDVANAPDKLAFFHMLRKGVILYLWGYAKNDENQTIAFLKAGTSRDISLAVMFDNQGQVVTYDPKAVFQANYENRHTEELPNSLRTLIARIATRGRKIYYPGELIVKCNGSELPFSFDKQDIIHHYPQELGKPVGMSRRVIRSGPWVGMAEIGILRTPDFSSSLTQQI